MKSLRLAGLALGLAMVAACVPRPAPPPDVPEPEPPRPAPVPPAPPPPAIDWRDAPLSSGGWSYRDAGGTPFAEFGARGAPAFAIRCDQGRQIGLWRIGETNGNAIVLRTSYGDRTLSAAAQHGPREALVATINPSDPLLDQIAFSRGRFAVEAAGSPMLIIPAWPEAARVIEDCRS